MSEGITGNGNGDKRGVTWKIMFGLASTMLGSIALILWFSTTDRIRIAEARIDTKVDRIEHDKDIAAIRELFEIIREDIRAHDRKFPVKDW